MRINLISAFVLIFVSLSRGDEQIDYLRQVKPVLQARCYACHGVLKQKGGLRLDTSALAIKGGTNGSPIAPGDSAKSHLLERITSDDDSDRMPPEGEPLKPSEIAAIKDWIAQGAKAPANETPERDPREHWAFKTPIRPAVPTLKNQAWVKNPIDAFIGFAHEKQSLFPQHPAEKRLWLRRVSLDLIGLPPTGDEQAAFVADQSPLAYENVVDRLLASPAYGERWGRHWMDIWRYSDWWGLGAEVRNSQKHIWHWRDWIIESLNSDKGYDQMLREMLAADELYPTEENRLRATGFLARQYFKFNRTSWLDETIEHTGKAILGLTFNCAKCHDHKYDPLTQVEYYQLRAFFEPYQVRTDAVATELNPENDGIPRVFDCNLDAPTFLHIRGDERNPDKKMTIKSIFPAFLTREPVKIVPVSLPPEAVQPSLRPFVFELAIKQVERDIEVARKKLDLAKAEMKTAQAKLATRPPAIAAKQPLVSEDFTTARPEIWEMRRGKWDYLKGKLIQSHVSATDAILRLKHKPPTDFEAVLQYIPTGGMTWKSVGIHFDVTEQNDISVYLSANEPGPKSQVSFKKNGSFVYPPEGAQARKVALNHPHELRVVVQGTLVNVHVDGQPSVAYRLPISRQPGFIEISAFDATAEFSRFELRELAPGTPVFQPGAAPELLAPERLVQRANLSVGIAEKALCFAEFQITLLKARAAADRVKYLNPSAPNRQALITAAAHVERESLVMKAEESLSQAELEVAFAEPQKKGEAEKKHNVAKTALDTAQKALLQPSTNYTSLSGSLKTLENNLETEESRRKPFPATSTGRRATFARWITDPKHPLPARVAVNHIWNRHFGKPLVPTVFDFGLKGTPPTHPELLDWLATELVEHNWGMKHIHRLITTSNTYRQASSTAGASPSNIKIDSDNRYYWHTNAVRMESEIIRDSLLHLGGELDRSQGGPSIPVENADSKRRSMYYVHSHNQHQQFLEMFDDASVLECYRRAQSIVPQQALALENSPFASNMAEKIARQIASKHPKASEAEFIRHAFLAILATEPSQAEKVAVQDAMTLWTTLAQEKKHPEPEIQAKIHLIQALINHNDFVTIR